MSRQRIRFVSLTAAIALALAGCGNSPSSDPTHCPAGQDFVCHDGTCKCGPKCTSASDCTGGTVCVCHDLSNDGACLSQADASSLSAHGELTCTPSSCRSEAPHAGAHCGAGQSLCGSELACCNTGDFYCNGTCYGTEQEASRTCGPGVCLTCGDVGGGTGTTGTGTSTGTSGSSGSTGTQCSEVSCVQVAQGTGACSDHWSIVNNCAFRVTCHYARSDGQSGCEFADPGVDACAIYQPSAGLSVTLNCVDGTTTNCDGSVGCL